MSPLHLIIIAPPKSTESMLHSIALMNCYRRLGHIRNDCLSLKTRDLDYNEVTLE